MKHAAKREQRLMIMGINSFLFTARGKKMHHKGTVKIYFSVYSKSIDGVTKRTNVILHKEENVTIEQARGLYLDVAGMNQDKNVHYEWTFYS